MRHIIFLLFCSLSMITNAQLVVDKIEPSTIIGKVKTGGYLLASLEYRLDEDKDTIYTLRYRNQKYTTLLEYEYFTFSNEGNTINQFYDILKTFFTEENKKNKEYQMVVKFGDKSLALSNFRMMGVTSVMILQLNAGYCALTEKQVNKLFGREADNNDD